MELIWIFIPDLASLDCGGAFNRTSILEIHNLNKIIQIKKPHIINYENSIPVEIRRLSICESNDLDESVIVSI